MGKVPAIADGKARLAESAAIALYLADAYPEAALAPALDDPRRGAYLYWSVFAAAVIEPAMMERFNGWEVNPGSSGWGNFDRMIQALEGGLETGPWILGEKFSAADTLVGSAAHFMRVFGILPDSEILAAYADRCLERPAYQTALAADEATDEPPPPLP
jgi:glutathione S-transferase